MAKAAIEAGKITDTEVEVVEIKRGLAEFCIIGETPVILRKMSGKGVRDILYPRGPMTRHEKKTNLKHDPLPEFRESPYTDRNPDAPTLITMRSECFKGAMRSAAVDIDGFAKAQVGRLCYVRGAHHKDQIHIFGVPQMLMSVVRSADINHTPDVRTRLIIPRWACRVLVQFAKPLMNDRKVAHLLASAGVIRGVGEWRPEKGSGDFGQWRLTSSDDPEFLDILATGGRPAQVGAMDTPGFYDDETEELFSWFQEERARRMSDNDGANRPEAEGEQSQEALQ